VPEETEPSLSDKAENWWTAGLLSDSKVGAVSGILNPKDFMEKLRVKSVRSPIAINLVITCINCLNLDAQLALEKKFFVDRVINVCNALPSTTNFASLNVFRNSIENIDFSSFSRL